MTKTVLPILALTLACNTPCPAGHDPQADPDGRACQSEADCEIECVCVDPVEKDDENSVTVGDCVGGTCVAAEDACRGACGDAFYTGEFCEP